MIKIIYGTCGGNTQMVCETLKTLWESTNEVQILQVKMTKESEMQGADLLVLACPTYGRGELEPYFEKFLNKCENPNLDLKDQKFAVIGLGDVKYDDDYVMESANILTQFMKEKSGKELVPALRLAGSPVNQSERVLRWGNRVLQALTNNSIQTI